jgi:hypothetical protein
MNSGVIATAWAGSTGSTGVTGATGFTDSMFRVQMSWK